MWHVAATVVDVSIVWHVADTVARVPLMWHVEAIVYEVLPTLSTLNLITSKSVVHPVWRVPATAVEIPLLRGPQQPP